jgi:hypothetical protein
MEKKLKYVVLIIVIGLFFHSFTFAQEYFRITAEFTVKVKNSDGTLNLTKGKVFYDKNYKELIYEISFPQNENWVIKDTSLIIIRKDTLYKKTSIPSINEFTVFHLALNSNLNDFGLKNSIYKINKVEKKKDLVLSYWKIPNQVSTVLDHVIIAKKDNRLESVVMIGNESKILSRQFFKDYQKFEAFEFPRQIVQILYDTDGLENYQITEFKNLKINDLENNNFYHSNF